jgi:predicted alpha/beta-fold hydrolase
LFICFMNLTTIVHIFNFRQLFNTPDGGTIALDWVTNTVGMLKLL